MLEGVFEKKTQASELEIDLSSLQNIAICNNTTLVNEYREYVSLLSSRVNKLIEQIILEPEQKPVHQLTDLIFMLMTQPIKPFGFNKLLEIHKRSALWHHEAK